MHQAIFFGLPFLTAPGEVMTPRPASEQLVATAVECVGSREARVADVGTGSGALAVAIALAAPRAEVWASDVSAMAVVLARANAHRLGVADRVHVVRGDLLEPLPHELDLIVANLPYLPRYERERHADLLEEPDQAVFASGDGLGPYRRLLDAAEDKLAPGGAVAIQLHRRVLLAGRSELPRLRAALGERAAALPVVA